MKIKFYAFTLAEILITIGIIGVIAALITPALISNVQDRIRLGQFKKTYSMLNSVIQKSKADLGYLPQCYSWLQSPYSGGGYCINYDARGGCIAWGYSDGSPRESDYQGPRTECSTWVNQIKNNLKIIKTCPNQAYANGCIPAYKGTDTIYMESNENATEDDAYINTSGWTSMREANIRNNTDAYVLADGTILMSISNGTEFKADINGKSGPNRWGYDVFYFIIQGASDGRLKLVGYTAPVEKGGKSARDMILAAF